MQFKIFDKNEQLKCVLKDIISAESTEEINGEHTLTFEILGDNEGAEYIEKGARVVFKDEYDYWQEFIVKKIEDKHGANGLYKTVFCESSFYEALGDYIEDSRVQGGTARIALEKALLNTRWAAGIVDDLGTNSITFYHIDCKTAVHKVAEKWKGELRTRVIVSGSRITHRYVDLLARRGADTGKRFTYRKDLEEVERIVHNEDVITALYGYGKGEEIGDGYGRRLTFEGVEWSKAAGDPADKPAGQRYIGDEEAREAWGRMSDTGRVHIFDKVEFDDVEDPEELLQLTYEKLQEVNRPMVSYSAKVVDLRAAEGYEHEGVELGDTVAVIDREFKPELRLKARVIRLKRDLLNSEKTEVVLGNFLPTLFDGLARTEEYISDFRGKSGVWDRAALFDADGLPGQYLKDLVAELNSRINAAGGYVYISEDGKGITTYDKPIDQDPTMAIQIMGGSFRIANSKTAQGEWNWTTFGDGNGFLADAFVGGLLKGGKVEFDLTNGTLLIGNSVADHQLLWDGETLSVKGALHIGPETTYEPVEEFTLERYQDMTLQEII